MGAMWSGVRSPAWSSPFAGTARFADFATLGGGAVNQAGPRFES
jgi:hypothetical protein